MTLRKIPAAAGMAAALFFSAQTPVNAVECTPAQWCFVAGCTNAPEDFCSDKDPRTCPTCTPHG
uniref:Uncharacterized protein n=1 Tax=Candidatus Kentrum eta TaxID=2126337 RepID=A0A450UVM0_9GAMM|nr:MAG: hypothetical protein BECKH772A_GA0070896_101069 [Candidatus Kentron sp. H]VFJ97985.1 MAG: hypothetical protein BECKH772B_GA0070898_101238 [Candidatus Kentron sp. H]VFK03123.1 MAG: hypothetical protein BECKH772C_GA0070978_101148 [Candidatus Kentron sp. H]